MAFTPDRIIALATGANAAEGRPGKWQRRPCFLLVPERCHRINPTSSPRGNPAGQRHDNEQKRGYTDENGEAERAVRESVKGNHEGKKPSDRRAPDDRTQVLANNL